VRRARDDAADLRVRILAPRSHGTADAQVVLVPTRTFAYSTGKCSGCVPRPQGVCILRLSYEIRTEHTPQWRPGFRVARSPGSRLDPGVIPFRKASECRIHVSGGEFNCAANLADCFGLKTGIVTAMVKYPIGT